MTTHINEPTPRKPLRLWPGALAAALMVLLFLGLPLVVPDGHIFGLFGAIGCAFAILVWWVFFSRAPWSERLGAVGLMVVALAATRFVLHESITGGMMGRMPVVFGIPVLSFALAAGAVASRRLTGGARRAALVAAILLGCGLLALVRTGGVSGTGGLDLHWRWTKTPEERLLAQGADEPKPLPQTPARAEPPKEAAVEAGNTPAPAPAPAASKKEPAAPAESKPATRVDWPGFRGPGRDGVVRGVRIETDWSRKPPSQLWRRPIGPGWSSFAVRGDLVFTQEQRGDDEVVSAYSLRSGEPVWRHRDAVRFYESNGGAGPRGTPTISGGRIYTLGATGVVNALDARDGSVIWSRNAATDTSVTVPDWGVASSPLVIDDVVVVAVSGRLAGYDISTGNLRWLGPAGGGGYSSPHLMTIDGVPQILLLRGSRTISVAPVDGAVLWEHTWQPGVGIVQPGLAPNGDVLIAIADVMGGLGIRRLSVARGSTGWTVAERWTSRGLKPYFNDFVVHKGHAFGFDGSILSCIDLNDGNRKWKGGRFGHGQLVLLSDQDLLLVLSEEGELALVSATSDKFTEVARLPAIEGKTWNHPVLVDDVLLVRNAQEMAAFRLSPPGR
jgi:outer membrane protein assembly factor BamB